MKTRPLINVQTAFLILFMTVFSTGLLSIRLLRGVIDEYDESITRLEVEKELMRLELEEFKKYGRKVTVTMYRPLPQETDSTPHILADGTRIEPERASDYRFVALSRNLLKRWGGDFDFGDWVLLKGTDKKDGIYQVRDTMNARWNNVVDILESKDKRPYKYSDVEIFKYALN